MKMAARAVVILFLAVAPAARADSPSSSSVTLKADPAPVTAEGCREALESGRILTSSGNLIRAFSGYFLYTITFDDRGVTCTAVMPVNQ